MEMLCLVRVHVLKCKSLHSYLRAQPLILKTAGSWIDEQSDL